MTLSDERSDIEASAPVFDGMLETPLRRVLMESAGEEIELTRIKVPSDESRIRIWISDISLAGDIKSPKRIMIVVD